MLRHKHSLNFVVMHVFMKILCTGSKQIVEESQKYFGFFACEPPYWYSHCSFSWSFQHIWKQFVQCLSRSGEKTHEWTFSQIRYYGGAFVAHIA